LYTEGQEPLWCGDIYPSFDKKADIVVAQGDSAELLKDVPNDSIQLIITSPPYNVGKEYENEIVLSDYLANIKPIIRELVRILKPSGSICWQVGNYINASEVYPLDIYYYNIFKEYHLQLRNRIIWHFGHGLHAKKRFSGRYEVILWFTKSDTYVFNLDDVRIPAKYPGKRHYKGPNYGKPSGNPKGKNPSDVWEVVNTDWDNGIWEIPNVKSNHPEKTIHPCQFPIELAERCVLALTNTGDWVLDPFAGVGSALLAAICHKRKAFGCEKEKSYIDITHKRIRDYYAGTLMYRKLGKPIYKPTGKEKISRLPKEWLVNKEDG
jgi:adenine-specific DNA-methyltransferase